MSSFAMTYELRQYLKEQIDQHVRLREHSIVECSKCSRPFDVLNRVSGRSRHICPGCQSDPRRARRFGRI
jgi:formamidopyrimidine-DNA glycosylase